MKIGLDNNGIQKESMCTATHFVAILPRRSGKVWKRHCNIAACEMTLRCIIWNWYLFVKKLKLCSWYQRTIFDVSCLMHTLLDSVIFVLNRDSHISVDIDEQFELWN